MIEIAGSHVVMAFGASIPCSRSNFPGRRNQRISDDRALPICVGRIGRIHPKMDCMNTQISTMSPNEFMCRYGFGCLAWLTLSCVVVTTLVVQQRATAAALEVQRDKAGRPALVIERPAPGLQQPWIQLFLADAEQSEALAPISLDLGEVTRVWDQVVGKLNKPIYPTSTQVVHNTTQLIEYADRRLMAIRAGTNSLGNAAAYGVELRSGRRLVFCRLEAWTDASGLVRISVDDVSRNSVLARPGKLHVWLLDGQKVAWSEIVDWPGVSEAGATAEPSADEASSADSTDRTPAAETAEKSPPAESASSNMAEEEEPAANESATEPRLPSLSGRPSTPLPPPTPAEEPGEQPLPSEGKPKPASGAEAAETPHQPDPEQPVAPQPPTVSNVENPPRDTVENSTRDHANNVGEAKAGFRIWTDGSGQHRVAAQMADFRDGQVILRLEDGELAAVPFEALAERDQQYVRQVLTEAAEKPSSPTAREATNEPSGVAQPNVAPPEMPPAETPQRSSGQSTNPPAIEGTEASGQSEEPDASSPSAGETPQAASPRPERPEQRSDTVEPDDSAQAETIEQLVARIEEQWGADMSSDVRKHWVAGCHNYFKTKNPLSVRRAVFMSLLRSCYRQQPPGALRDAFADLYVRLRKGGSDER